MNAPDIGRGKRSANNILNIIEAKKEGSFGSYIVDGDRELTNEIASRGVEFRHVWFKYPTS